MAARCDFGCSISKISFSLFVKFFSDTKIVQVGYGSRSQDWKRPIYKRLGSVLLCQGTSSSSYDELKVFKQKCAILTHQISVFASLVTLLTSLASQIQAVIKTKRAMRP
jgi:hypothetical protein